MKSRKSLSKIYPEFGLYFIFFMLFVLAVCFFGGMNNIWDKSWGFWCAVYYVKTGIEVVAGGYVIFYMLVACGYSKPFHSRQTYSSKKQYTNIAVAYFCCDDLDLRALENIVESCVRYQTSLLIHDDSVSTECRTELDKIVTSLQQKYSLDFQTIRRSRRVGGKPGAINNLMLHLSPDIEFLLLCDSDSFLPQNNFLEEALSYFNSPEVAVVQFRNTGKTFAEDSHGYNILSASVDFYDAFVSIMDRFGWSPFLGHNAILRVSTIKKVGGFTAGQLADDIDYSVKLRLQGYQIRYARAVVAGERHPLTYGALRRRTQKWAFGCTQVLLRWGLAVLASSKLTLLDKVTFFLTVGYYHFQLLLLAYLTIFYICLPFHDPEMGGTFNLLVSAGLILFFTFMPSTTYFIRNKDLLAWPRAAVYWGFTYGSQDFVMLKAVIRCLIKHQLKWTPTNEATDRLQLVHFLPELLFGSLIVCVGALQHPTLLLLPTTILFAGKFLISPYLDKLIFYHTHDIAIIDSGSLSERKY